MTSCQPLRPSRSSPRACGGGGMPRPRRAWTAELKKAVRRIACKRGGGQVCDNRLGWRLERAPATAFKVWFEGLRHDAPEHLFNGQAGTIDRRHEA